MELIRKLIYTIFHLTPENLTNFMHYVGAGKLYVILFCIVFAETGLVVTPFLPGDSLLFALGALAAVDQTGTLHAPLIWLLLTVAAVLGNEVNFRIGRAIGPRAFSGGMRWLKQDYLIRTQQFYEKHGGKTIILSRFIPIIRTFAPFVAGVGQMRRRRFAAYNVVGGFTWVTLFTWGGYLFGNMPIVKENFGLVTIGIVVVSVLPVVWGLLSKPKSQAEA